MALVTAFTRVQYIGDKIKKFSGDMEMGFMHMGWGPIAHGNSGIGRGVGGIQVPWFYWASDLKRL